MRIIYKKLLNKKEITMNKHKSNLETLLIIIFLTGFIYISGFGKIYQYSPQQVKKVLNLIQRIEAHQHNQGIEEAVVSENELNSYIAYLIEQEKEEIIRELRLKLFDNNYLEGKIKVDLRGLKLSKMFKPQINLYFRAVLEVEKGKGRLNVKKLYVEENKVEPRVLDMIIKAGSSKEHPPARSIGDWYELPYGIKGLETKRANLIIYY